MYRVDQSPKGHDPRCDRVGFFLGPLVAVLRSLRLARPFADGVNASMCLASGVVALGVSVVQPLFFFAGAVLTVVGAALCAGAAAKMIRRSARKGRRDE